MAFNLFKKKVEVQETPSNKIDVNAPLIENKVICNVCGSEIDGNPRHVNLQGRRLFLHKKCFKKLQQGQINI